MDRYGWRRYWVMGGEKQPDQLMPTERLHNTTNTSQDHFQHYLSIKQSVASQEGRVDLLIFSRRKPDSSFPNTLFPNQDFSQARTYPVPSTSIIRLPKVGRALSKAAVDVRERNSE